MINQNKYIPFTESEIKKFINLFKSRIIIDNKKEVILFKFNSQGYKIYHNNFDQYYYLSIIQFNEPINLKHPVYYNIWNGNMILKLRNKTIDELINNLNSNPLFFNINLNLNYLYMIDYDKKDKRIIISTDIKKYTYEEYQSFFRWYQKNAIWIVVIKKQPINNEIITNEFKLKSTDVKFKYSDFFVKIDGDNKTINITDRKYLICFIN